MAIKPTYSQQFASWKKCSMGGFNPQTPLCVHTAQPPCFAPYPLLRNWVASLCCRCSRTYT